MSVDTVLPMRKKLSAKIVGTLVSFLMLALGVIGITLFLSWQLEGSAAAINDTGSIRMNSYRLAMLLARMPDDQPENQPENQAARQLAERQMGVIDTTLAQLDQGDPQRPLFLPPASAIRSSFKQLAAQWQNQLRPAAVKLLQQQPATANPANPAAPSHGTALRDFETRTEQFVMQTNALVQLIERDSEQRTFWLRASQLALLGLAMVGTVSIIYLMFGLIIEPVTRLHDGILRMAAKDFEVRLEVESEDEFGQLAHGFNQMAEHLQALYGNLEGLVKAKTAALEDQNRELALLYDSAAFLQLPQPVAALCDGFIQRISHYFAADADSVRVLDAELGNLHMVVHHGLSQSLVDGEHCLKVGDCLCGEAVQQKVMVVHDMRNIDRNYQLKCHQEGFSSVSVFHIHAHQQHLGFFNLHFRKAKTFSEREMALLETLGKLLGIAIENQRLAAREREMAISEERNLVAQGLHDSIAQGLNYLNLQVQMLDESVRDQKLAEISDIVPALRAGVKESYDDVRELLNNFRTRLAEDNLITSLEATVEKFRRQTGIRVELVADVDAAPFPREQQLQLLFIVQEALSNVRKHASASKVEIRLEDRPDFVLEIQDNGSGFDPALVAEKGDSHVGTHIMQERAQRIGASLQINSMPGAGTTVALRLAHELRHAA